MKYLILILLLGLILFWIFKKPTQKSIQGFTKNFVLNPEETVVHQFETYIPPRQKRIEEGKVDFFDGGKVFTLILTNHNRLVFLAQNQEAYIFDKTQFPTFKKSSKKANLQLFARVATAKVLEMQISEKNQIFEMHVPLEVVPILMNLNKTIVD